MILLTTCLFFVKKTNYTVFMWLKMYKCIFLIIKRNVLFYLK